VPVERRGTLVARQTASDELVWDIILQGVGGVSSVLNTLPPIPGDTPSRFRCY
jgi:hypothetical protein